MFSSKSRDAAPAPAPMNTPPAQPAPLSRKASRSTAPSILSADAVVTGTLVSAG